MVFQEYAFYSLWKGLHKAGIIISYILVEFANETLVLEFSSY